MTINEWEALIEENREAIKTELKNALDQSLVYSNMQYTVYIDADGDVWTHEDLTGSNWSSTRDDVKVVKVFNGDHWSWTDGFSPDECLAMVLEEASADERNAFEEWKTDQEYGDDTDASTLLEWWTDTRAFANCKAGSIAEIIFAYDFDVDVDYAIYTLDC